jgi:hypothetical protein
MVSLLDMHAELSPQRRLGGEERVFMMLLGVGTAVEAAREALFQMHRLLRVFGRSQLLRKQAKLLRREANSLPGARLSWFLQLDLLNLR